MGLRCLLKIPWDALGLRLWTPAASDPPAAIRTRHKLDLETGSKHRISFFGKIHSYISTIFTSLNRRPQSDFGQYQT